MYCLLANITELVSYVLCPDPTENCYLGYCQDCPNDQCINNLLKCIGDEAIEFKFWESKPVTSITTIVMEAEDFSERFRETLPKYLEHEFVYRRQKNFISEIKASDLNDGSTLIVTVDYGENYSFVIQKAVQGYHWTNKQCTVHPFCVYFRRNGEASYKTFFIISSDLQHDATAFHVFRGKVLQQLKLQFPQIKHIEYVSDGAASQYQNFKNMCNLVYHKQDYGITANWNFTATAHGKSTCDAMSAVVKRFVRLRALNENRLIVKAQHVFNTAREALTTEFLEFIYVYRSEVQYEREVISTRYEAVEKIPGIRKFHCMEIESDGCIRAKRYSDSSSYEKFCIFKEDNTFQPAEESDTEFTVDTFYAVLIGSKYEIGILIKVEAASCECCFSMMKITDREKVELRWPLNVKEQRVPYRDVLCQIENLTSSSPCIYEIAIADQRFIQEKLTARLADVSVNLII